MNSPLAPTSSNSPKKVYVKRPTDPQKIRELNAEQSRLVESNLKRLMAAENKVAMAAHKDTLHQHQQEILPVALGSADLANAVVVKEEPGLSSSRPLDAVTTASANARRMSVEADRRATKLEILPVVNYETAKRQQQLSASGRDQRHEMKGGHMRGESGVNSSGSGSGSGAGSIGEGANASGPSGSSAGGGNGRAEWRMERRRLRREQNLMEGRDDSSHKRQRQETQRMKLVSMEMDS